MADPEEAREELGVNLRSMDEFTNLDAVILAVSHDEYKAIPVADIKTWFANPDNALVIDVKGFFDRAEIDAAGIDLCDCRARDIQ